MGIRNRKLNSSLCACFINLFNSLCLLDNLSSRIEAPVISLCHNILVLCSPFDYVGKLWREPLHFLIWQLWLYYFILARLSLFYQCRRVQCDIILQSISTATLGGHSDVAVSINLIAAIVVIDDVLDKLSNNDVARIFRNAIHMVISRVSHM